MFRNEALKDSSESDRPGLDVANYQVLIGTRERLVPVDLRLFLWRYGMTDYQRYWVSSANSTIKWCDGATAPGANFGGSVKVVDTVTKGPNYKDWKQRLIRGDQCTTTLSGTRYRREFGSAYFSASQKPISPTTTCQSLYHIVSQAGLIQGANISLTPLTPDLTTIQKADALALAKFVESIRSTMTTAQGGVIAGELGETLHMLIHPAKTLRQGLFNYLATLKKRKRKLRSVRGPKRLSTARNIVADTWLEYSFGWKPLLHDIDDVMKTLANRFASTPPREPVYAKGVDEQFSSARHTSYSGNLIASISHQVNWTLSKQVVYRGSVRTEHPRAAVWNHFGSFANDFIPTVWELIPYSFLVDYFSNIGAMISAASLLRSNLVWASRTTVDSTVAEIVDTQAKATFSVFFTAEADCANLREKRSKIVVSRAPYTGSLVPSLYFTVPGLGSTKWINISALLLGQRALVPFHR